MSLFADKDIDRRFSRTQWRMLFATMIGYTLFYFMRKNFSFAMPGLEQDCGISKAMLGNFLFAGGIVYGISKFLNGIVGDRCNSRKMLCFGLLVCSLVNVAFGFAPQIAAWFTGGAEVPSYMTALAWTFGALLVLNQFFQGTGFPPCAKLIAFWVPPNELATKMSVWNTSHSIGGGLVAKVCGIIMGLGVIGAANQGVGMWRWCFCLYGPQALTGVTATNTSTKVFAGTSIGFISLFSYIGVSVSGKVCGSLAQSSHGWHQPLMFIIVVAATSCALFLCLWNVRANSYGKK